MGDVVIRVEGLGKRYSLGRAAGGHALRDGIRRSFSAPLRLLRGPAPAEKRDVREFWALQNVSFEVREGEVLGIIGRNGAGKSTLLKILSRITEPTAGSARVRGRVGALLEVGTGFHPELTGRENIYLNGAILGMRRAEIERKFDEIVAFAGIEAFLDMPVKRYSSGMYMRLAFAVAAHLEPEILVVDEVLAVGDAAFQKKCIGKMGEVSKHGRTVLFVSHNVGAVVTLCNRCLLLDEGRLIEEGPAADVIASYQAVLNQAPAHEHGLVDLRGAERYGTGRARFTSLLVRPSAKVGDDDPGRRFLRPGDDVEITVEIEARQAIADTNVAIVLYDEVGYRVVDANLLLDGKVLVLDAGARALVCFRFENLRLRPGSFLIGLWMGQANHEDADGITYAASILVEPDPRELKHSHIFPGVYQCRYSTTVRSDTALIEDCDASPRRTA